MPNAGIMAGMNVIGEEVVSATWIVETASAAETMAVGRSLGCRLRPGDVVALVGPLGAGKTCLAQGVARGLGIAVPLTSPTFILVNQVPLPGGGTLYHADTYRLGDPLAEAEAMGLGEIFEDEGIVLIEWAERVEELLPETRLWIELAYAGEEGRRITLVAHGPRYRVLLNELRASL